MAYFVGTNLHNRIHQAGLTELYELLSQVASGEAEWPQTCVITLEQPEDTERMRTLLYSILNELGIKPRFQVRVATRQLFLSERKPASGSGVGIQFGSGQPGPQPGPETPTSPGEVMGPEFRLDDEELFGPGAGQETEPEEEVEQ